ncbi:MAG: flagellar type III secretion system pore protein FliP [Lachnospiraceae bacterium]|nr:flagellar type III secretion system pore protein FliP [Lachnospiraceae bacterium]
MKRRFSGLRIGKILCLLLLVGIFCICNKQSVYATTLDIDRGETGETDTSTTLQDPGEADTPEELGQLNIANTATITVSNNNGTIAGTLRILITLTLIAVLPMIILMMTSFTRIIIVLHFTRAALSTQTVPPNQILIGLALILTFFIMEPTINEVYNDAIVPFEEGRIEQDEALTRGIAPLRKFMYRSTQTEDVRVFMEIARLEWDGETLEDIPISVLIPSYMISELRLAFTMGFVIYIPFIVIDMVVASTLMSMGMMMLPPTTISMPIKILLFVVADGWNLIIVNLVRSFYLTG